MLFKCISGVPIRDGTILYSYKFSRDVNFAVFANNVWSTKIKSSKIYIL